MGFSIGGSYAKGTWCEGDDVDMYLLYDDYPYPPEQSDIILYAVRWAFTLQNLEVEVMPLAFNAMDRNFLLGLIRPQTPYVVRSSQIAEKWQLDQA